MTGGAGVTRRLPAGQVLETVVAVLLFGTAAVEVAADAQPPLPVAVAIPLAAAVALPVAASRRAPAAAAATSLAAVALQGVAPHLPSSIAELIALALANGQAAVRVARFRLPLLLLGLLAAAVQILRSRDDVLLSDDVFTAGVLVLPFLVGLVIRRRLRAAAAARERTRIALEQRRERARLAVQEERARVARELHDVVAHALSVVVVQAVGGRTVLRADPAAAAGAFDTIRETGARALDELARLLGALRAAEDVADAVPGVDAIVDLARVATEAGLPTVVTVRGRPVPLPSRVELSAYRIVQEALTNAVRHAAGGAATVEVRHGDALRVAVRNGPGAPGLGPLLPGSGNGILGMRERAALCGGTLHAAPTPEGGFAVEAVLPVVAR